MPIGPATPRSMRYAEHLGAENGTIANATSYDYDKLLARAPLNFDVSRGAIALHN